MIFFLIFTAFKNLYILHEQVFGMIEMKIKVKPFTKHCILVESSRKLYSSKIIEKIEMISYSMNRQKYGILSIFKHSKLDCTQVKFVQILSPMYSSSGKHVRAINTPVNPTFI